MRALESPIVFECAGEQLVGILHTPERARDIGVVVVVGGPQYRVGSHRQFTLMARAFANAGYPVFRFDYRGMGDSDGAIRTFEQVDQDIRSAIDVFLHAQPHVSKVVLWGLCDAASACMMYGNCADQRVSGLVVVNPWVRTQTSEAAVYLKHYYAQRLLQRSFWIKLFSGALNLRRAFRELRAAIRRASGAKEGTDKRDLGSYIDRMLKGIRRRSLPVLLITSGRDLTAKEFEELCSRDPSWRAELQMTSVTTVRCDRADHTFSNREDLNLVTSESGAWLDRLFAANH